MHECPECECACYCGGDIDDMLMDGTREEQLCGHWQVCEGVDDDEFFSATVDADQEP